MWRVSHTCVFTFLCLLLLMETNAQRLVPESSASCRANYNLSLLANETVASYEVQASDGRRPRTILTILEAALNSSSREEAATRLNISVRCLEYLKFSVPEVALFLLNSSEFNEVTFDDVFRAVFVSDIESVLSSMFFLKHRLSTFHLAGNETLQEFAMSNNLSVESTSILDILLTPFNISDVRQLSLFFEVSVSHFELLNRTTRELAAILDVDNPGELKNYTLLRFIKISFVGKVFINSFQITIRNVRDSLHVTWIEIVQGELANVSSVLELVLAKVPRKFRSHLTSLIIGQVGYDLSLLNVTLWEIAQLTNKSVVDLQTYKVYPTLVSFIIKTKVAIIKINRETRNEVGGAIREILEAYNVNISQLQETFSLTELQFRHLSPLKIEVFCTRFTLIRYVTNLNLTLAEVAVKVNRTEAELSYNLTVKDFHVVIRKLVVVRTFEVMSRMLGVSEHFLVNSLSITVPVSSLSMCQLDEFLRVTRRTALSLHKVITQKSLAFAVQINGFSITFVYKLTVEQFIIQVMHLNVREFFSLNGLDYTYSPSRLRILVKYHFIELERLFQIHKDIPDRSFAIFRYSLKWIINRIIFLIETDVNECSRGTDECHRLSECINLPGTYQCRCPPINGYAGKHCDDINECREGTAVCPLGSDCVNIPGSYRCECKNGFRHNVTHNTCDDINECDSIFDNNCYWGNLQCINTVGSYECRCADGLRYSYNYRRCRDINECQENPYRCSDIDANAVCSNTYRSYKCSCSRGYIPYYNTSVSPRVLINCTDIDECATGDNVCPRKSVCVNTIGGAYCRCFPGYEKRGKKCKAKRFVKYLTNQIRYVRYKKGKCERVRVPSGFLYFGKLHKKLYICPNGLISVGKKYYRKNPKRLRSLRKDVLAFFWVNTAITGHSTISYQDADRSTPELRQQLDAVSNTIRNCSGAFEFHATWMLIVTWARVSPYGRSYEGQESTYQAVLVTNGTSSYAIYTYQDGGMLWRTGLRRRCAVGYSTKNGAHSYEEEDSFSDNIFSIDTKEFDVNGVRRPGFFCKSLNVPDAPIVLTNEQRCMNWYNEEPDPDSWLEELSDCPATRNTAKRDNRYRRVTRTRRNIYCYELKFPTPVYGASHQCCYFRRGRRKNAFVGEPPLAGKAYRYHYWFSSERQRSDIEPFQACCSERDSTLCSLFYEKRPLTTAVSVRVFPLPCPCLFVLYWRPRPPRRRRRRRRVRRGRMNGEPHVATLDGLKYTFNGLGDYVLLRSQDNSLHLHGRTERPLTTEGELVNATVFSGFVVKTNTSDTAQILFDKSLPGNLSITVIRRSNSSCTNHTIEYFNEGQNYAEMSIERSSVDNNTVIVSFPSGFSIEVTPGVGLLQLSMSASEDIMNITQGLMGNFNGDKTDDLEYPNGTIISANSTEQEIFHLGQQWKVPDEERMFVSPSCMLQNVSFDEAFVPAFLNMSALTPEIVAVCGSSRECIYDVLETGNYDLGKQTAAYEEEHENIVNELDNTPPEINGPEEINVTLNELTQFYISSTDPDNDAVTLDIEELPTGASFNSTTGHFEWTPVNTMNITLEFIATDTKNASTVLTVVINMCQCQNNGECDHTEFVGDSSGAFRVVGCNCSEQYEGTFCETELLDACDDEPCFDNVTCNATRNPFGFQCGPCPVGLTGDGENCIEIDECTNASVSRCSQTCVNTFGGFYCECRDGFIKREEGRICEDINECQEVGNLRHNCTQNAMCMNLPGSFNCSCNPGYEGDPYTNCTDKDECTNGDALCSQRCTNTPGSFVCACQDGFQLGSNMATCEDINECTSNHNCERICNNLIGSYKCGCPPGLELNADNRTCKVAEGSACDSTNGGCEHICVNRTGMVTCYCNPGYNLTNNEKHCEDINECMTGTHDCSQRCSNSAGNYTCGCHPGYQLGADRRTCNDVNECNIAGLNNCSQICENSEGSFQCACASGFILQSDNTSCNDVDECNSSPSTKCSAGSCVNVPGSFECRCPTPMFYAQGDCRGTRLFAMSMTLTVLNGKSLVWQAAYLNIRSSEFGYVAVMVEKQINWFFQKETRLSGRFISCKLRKLRQGSVVADVDLHFAENATHVTDATVNDELPQSGQMGNLTYDPSTAKISDFDECDDEATHNCHAHAQCVNKAGSFDCKCMDGYQGDGRVTCDEEPKPTDDDAKKKKLAIILGSVFGVLLLIIIVAICCSCRNRRYKADMEESNQSVHMATRSVRSDLYFPENIKDKKETTGSYEVNPAPMYGNTDGPQRRTTVSSGDYDFPDPYPQGKRTTHHDNPAFQKEQDSSF